MSHYVKDVEGSDIPGSVLLAMFFTPVLAATFGLIVVSLLAR